MVVLASALGGCACASRFIVFRQVRLRRGSKVRAKLSQSNKDIVTRQTRLMLASEPDASCARVQREAGCGFGSGSRSVRGGQLTTLPKEFRNLGFRF